MSCIIEYAHAILFHHAPDARHETFGSRYNECDEIICWRHRFIYGLPIFIKTYSIFRSDSIAIFNAWKGADVKSREAEYSYTSIIVLLAAAHEADTCRGYWLLIVYNHREQAYERGS